ncbi:MAG: hypothetical protein QOH16_690 [Gaiellaceae bacterium]|nr:hypothetical protein [Gaiellaceae bacterium]
MRFPSQPKFIDGAAHFSSADELIILGGAEPVVLTGGAANAVLPNLISTLDGHTSFSEIAQRLGLSEPQVRHAIRLLYSKGLIEERASTPAERPTPQVTYFSRVSGHNRGAKAGVAAASELSHATALVTPDSFLARAVSESIASLGVSISTINTAGRGGTRQRTTRGPTFLVCALAAGQNHHEIPIALEEAERSRRSGSITLITIVDDRRIVLGPIMDQTSTCVSCVWSGIGRVMRDAPVSDDPEDFEWGAEDLVSMAGVLAANRIANYVLRASTAATLRSIINVDVNAATQEGFFVAADSQCQVCCSVDGGHLRLTPRESSRAELPTVYEQYVAASTEFRDSLDLATVNPDPGKLMGKGRDYLTHPRTPLPPLAPVDRLEVSTMDSLQRLIALLDLTGGVRVNQGGNESIAGRVRRLSPTGGNLGSPQLFVVRQHEEQQYAYYFDPFQRALIHLTRGVPPTTPSDRRYWAGTGTIDLVVVGDTDRLQAKYGAFAFKLSHLDVGCAVRQALTAATVLGLRPRLKLMPAFESYGALLLLNPSLDFVGAAITIDFDHDADHAVS